MLMAGNRHHLTVMQTELAGKAQDLFSFAGDGKHNRQRVAGHVISYREIRIVNIDDPYFPVTNDMARNALAIVLSVSGETEEILRFASQFSLHHCKVMSITSHEHSRLAKLADFNLSWHVPQTRIGGVYDITTQIPVIYILESLGRKLARKIS